MIEAHRKLQQLVAGLNDQPIAEASAIIETTAGRSATEHRPQLAEHTAGLEASWARHPT
ncbi:hypothetical protein AB0H94_11230 [Streptomyces purpurascens]|uniref:hypothetical protein n=1 Tax=Streptomyces purpurascens TaxID=1924 RepID=UPI0033C73137